MDMEMFEVSCGERLQLDWKKPAGNTAVISAGAFQFNGRSCMGGIYEQVGINATVWKFAALIRLCLQPLARSLFCLYLPDHILTFSIVFTGELTTSASPGCWNQQEDAPNLQQHQGRSVWRPGQRSKVAACKFTESRIIPDLRVIQRQFR